MQDYMVYKSQLIIDNQPQIIYELERAHYHFTKNFHKMDPTWGYAFYNIFAITSPSPLFYDILQEMKQQVREFTGVKGPMWFQSWINYHKPDEVLDWHDHQWPWHGYFSIDPKNTKTVFEGYEIINEVGNVYIGPGFRKHKVEVLESYETPRITLGFDIETRPNLCYEQFSLIPF